MAKSLPLLLLGVFLVAGCQQQAPQPVAQRPLPRPNLDGPRVAMPPKLELPKPPPLPAPATRPATPRGFDVPTAWLPATRPNPWRWIVIHHSATPGGSATVFDADHRKKGWDELGYHFVVGNGTYSADGSVEVGSRWPKQKWGAHAKTPDNQFNNYGIGICVVGDFEMERPTPAQQASIQKLVAYLMHTYNIPADRVIGHGETKPTHCPGRNLSIAAVRAGAIQRIAAATGKAPVIQAASTAELLQPLPQR